MSNNLVIVESPAKARTLGQILGKGYSLKASLGHVRDLPKSQLGVEVDNDFAPKYVIPRLKSKLVKELKEAAGKAKAVYLATDPDREGEAISWHLMEITRTDKKPFRRVVFHEITKEAVEQAFKHPRTIDMKLVDAQQARRILDRLVGYKISPLLWRKVRKGLSAGRVQSVAVKIVVDREREIQSFVPVEYWTIEAELARKDGGKSFRAQLVSHGDGAKLDVRSQNEADDLKKHLETAGYRVGKVATKKVTRQPAPPFITSTLQQEAWRKLRFSARQTMQVAQQLYEGLPLGDEGEGGLITYIRTDSTHIASSAISETREFIARKYGAEFVPERARAFTRAVKGAQEAHEAIRPTRISREPLLVKRYLTPAQFRLYQLVWQRMVASQMSAALFDSTTVDIKATPRASRSSYLFRASSLVNRFQGFIILYVEDRDEADGDGKKDASLPRLQKDDDLKLLGLSAEQRFTQPPPRYTEASLVKVLEQEGIGRPSTYAPIMSTIQEREYVTKTKGVFQPTELGFVVNDLLVQYFADIVNVRFTARLEEELDEIARDDRNWVSVVRDFYTPFEKTLEKASQVIEKVKLADELTGEACPLPQCGKPLVVKTGRFGKFIGCSGYPECRFTQPYQVKTGAKCPKCGHDIMERISKKGRPFYKCSKPDCDFVGFVKPLPRPCPRCGGLLIVNRGKSAKCTKCDYRGKLEDLPAEAEPGAAVATPPGN